MNLVTEPTSPALSLSPHITMTRQQRIEQITQVNCWDLVIVGGGITGAGVLKLASLLGLKVLLLEQKDFAWGSSSRSSKMVHGGLRYMAQGQFKLTRESVVERQRLLAEAGPLVTKQSFVMSHYKGGFPSPWLFNRLLSFYDLFAGVHAHKFWHKSQYISLVPQVKEKGLLGGTQFYDALTDDARLTQRLIQEALQRQGQALNYAKVCAISPITDKSNSAVNDANAAQHIVEVEIAGQTQKIQLQSKVVINASGAWSQQFKQTQSNQYHMRPLRGSHIIVPSWRLPVASVITLRHKNDKRPVQIYPWQNVTVIGTTDVEHQAPLNTEANISTQEFNYLLTAVQQQFPNAHLTGEDVISTFSGVRPVMTNEANLAPSKENREHHIEDNNGIISVVGGKLTTFRLIAEQVLTASNKYLNVEPHVLRNCCQQAIFSPLLGANAKKNINISAQLQGSFAEFAPRYLQGAVAKDLQPISYSRHIWAELLWAVKYEQVYHLDDLMLRRTRIGNVLPKGAIDLLPEIQRYCEKYLPWNEQKWQDEIQRYRDIWQQFYGVPVAASISEIDK